MPKLLHKLLVALKLRKPEPEISQIQPYIEGEELLETTTISFLGNVGIPGKFSCVGLQTYRGAFYDLFAENDKLMEFVEAIADGDYQDMNLELLQIVASRKLEECQKIREATRPS